MSSKHMSSLSIVFVLLVSALHSDVFAASVETPETQETALIIIDVQNCFLPPSGELAVSNGNEVIPVINRIRQDYSSRYRSIVVTQDWHCRDHISFASTHPGYEPYSSMNLTYNTDTGELCSETETGGVKANSPYAVECDYASSGKWTTLTQKLWPDHCIQGTSGAQVHPELVRASSDLIIHKGQHCQVDSYSAFFDNGGLNNTELHDKLVELDVTAVHIVGLATDFCVFYTAKDAAFKLGYDTTVILDATRGIAEDSTQKALEEMAKLGVKVINSTDLKAIFKSSASTMTSYIQLVVWPTAVIAILNMIRS